jgi:hypothetical protein
VQAVGAQVTDLSQRLSEVRALHTAPPAVASVAPSSLSWRNEPGGGLLN